MTKKDKRIAGAPLAPQRIPISPSTFLLMAWFLIVLGCYVKSNPVHMDYVVWILD